MINRIFEAKKLYENKEYDKALKVLDSLEELNLDVLNLYAEIFKSKKMFNEAIETYNTILQYIPNDYNALFNISTIYLQNNDIQTGLKYALNAYKINSSDINLLFQIAQMYSIIKSDEDEIFYLEQIIKIKKDINILYKLGIMYRNLKNIKKAAYYFEECININKDFYNAIINLIYIYSEECLFEKAEKYLNRVKHILKDDIRLHKAYFTYYKYKKDWINVEKEGKIIVNLSEKKEEGYAFITEAYYKSIDYNQAVEYCNKGLEYNPNNEFLLYSKACCLDMLNKENEALELINKIYEINPDYDNAYILEQFIYLKRKKYNEAMNIFKIYYFEKHKNRIKHKFEKFQKNVCRNWRNEDIKDKTILVYNNEGFGDALMFSRYIPILEKKAKKVIVYTQQDLYDLFKYNFKLSEVIKENYDKELKFDYTSSYLELFYNLNLDLYHIPYAEGWLKISDNSADKTKELDIFKTNKPKVGIFWQGNKYILQNRSISLEEMQPIFNCDNLQFYSLEISDLNEKTLNFFKENNIIDCSKYIKSFYDTASIMKNLDLFITIDSSVLHLAGALGVKTFLMLPENTEWRWFYDNKTTPWYNSVRIFRQTKQEDWSDVVSNISKELLSI